MVTRKELQKAIDLQLAGDGSALRETSRELLAQNHQLVELVENILPNIANTFERGKFRAHLKRITEE